MDERNVLASEDVYERLYPNLESSKISAENSAKQRESPSGFLPSAEHIHTAHFSPADSKQRSANQGLLSFPETRASGIEPSAHISAENQQFAGDRDGVQDVGVSSSDRKRSDGRICVTGGSCAGAGEKEILGHACSQMQAGITLDVDADCTSHSQHSTNELESSSCLWGSDLANEHAKESGEIAGISEVKQDAVVFASSGSVMTPGTLDDAVHSSPDEQVPKGIHIQLDSAQLGGATDLVDFVKDEGRQGEASLEMLSVAVESFENMQRENEGSSGGSGKVVEGTVAGKEVLVHDNEHDVDEGTHHLVLAGCGIGSLVKKSVRNSEDIGSFILAKSKTLGEEFQNKDHFLSLLCELAAVQQQEQEFVGKCSDHVASCAANFVENGASGELKRLSFVDLLRKQMAQVGTFSELTADAFYEEFLRQNQAILGTTLVKDLNLSFPSAGISSNAGDGTSLEVEQISNGNSGREGDTRSNEEIVDDSRNGEAQDEVDGCSPEDEDKKEVGGEEMTFGVGDLVWAKVKSHPWWPGQIFNASDASAAAKKIQRPGRTLVAFFGDGTFGWLQHSQLIAFQPNFEEKVKQTTMKSFCKAVAEALNEVSRRTELGLRCSHSSDAVYSKDVFPDLNAGMRKGVRIKCHQDIRMSREGFEPKKVMEFVQSAARSPLYSLSSGLEYSKLCGHAYAFRNFMLSPKKPKSKIIVQNMSKVQDKLKAAQSSSSKRRLELDETGGGPSMLQGKDAKRLHSNKDMMMKERHAGNRVQSPKIRTIENSLLTEADENKVIEAGVKSPERSKGSTWLAKGKRLQVSPDHKEGKRAKGWHSLGPLGDLADSRGADNIMSTDDDSKTLLDITGFHSLKRKKRGVASKSMMDIVSEKVEQQSLSKLEKTGDEEDNFPDSSTSSLSTAVPDHNLSILSMPKESGIVEEREKVKEELQDLIIDDEVEMEKGNKELLGSKVSDADKGGIQDLKLGDGWETVEEKRELQSLRDNTDAEEHQMENEELPDLKVGDAKESEEDEGKILDVKESEPLVQDVNDHNILRMQTECLYSHCQEQEKDDGEFPNLKVGDAEGSEKVEGKLEDLSVSLLQDVKHHDTILERKKQQVNNLHSHSQKHKKDKGELPAQKVGDAEESEKEKGKIVDLKDSESLLQDVNDHERRGKKQVKRLHCQDEEPLSLLAKSKKRKQDTCKEGESQLSPSCKNEHLGSKKSVKSSKLGASIKKIADSLKDTPANSKLANNLSAKRAVSAASVESEAKKHLKSPRSSQSSAFKNLAEENVHSSLAKLLNNLQAVARDPVSSAKMKSSLHGVMSTFLKFRSMVFLKSPGYGSAGTGKLTSSCGNGHLSGGKKVDDKGGSGKQTLPLERQKSFVTDSSEERKSIVKSELPSESAGPGSQRHAAQDSSSDLKAAALKKPAPSTAFASQKTVGTASQKADVPKTSTDVETASGEMPICSKTTTGGNQKLGVQELAVAARKRKSEVLKESAAKVQAKNEALKAQNLLKEMRVDKEKFTDTRHHSKSVKHHVSRAGTLPLPERKSPMHSSVDLKVTQTSLGLFMQFPEDFVLPSEVQLKETFSPFGALEVAGVRVYKNASTAQVVFKHSIDAEAAWQHARKNRMFGHANVSYRLRHFSLSTKSSSKCFEVASAKNGLSAEAAVDVKSPMVENHVRPDHSRSSSASGAEQGGSLEATHSFARILSIDGVEPADLQISAPSPGKSPSLSKAEPAHSPVRSTPSSRAEPVGLTVFEPSPVMILSHIGAELAASSTASAPVGNSLHCAEQGDSMLPACAPVFQKQEDSPSLGTPAPPYSNPFNLPAVSNVSTPCGDIQDEMLKLLQQVSVIVTSSTFTPRTT